MIARHHTSVLKAIMSPIPSHTVAECYTYRSMHGKYPNTFYRVGLKALIRNNKDEVLLVKENSDKWDLPGGGLDHGEAPEDCLRRELLEETGLTGLIIDQPLVVKSFWLEDKQSWIIWVVYSVSLGDWGQKPMAGVGVSDIQFLNPAGLAESLDERESAIAEIAWL